MKRWSQLIFVCALGAIAGDAVALPHWSSSYCSESNTYGAMESTTASVVHYYIQSDFASELAACTPNATDNSELTEFHVRQKIKDAAEVFNAESRAAFLRYGGTYSGDPVSSCASYSKPTVFVRFQPGCQWSGDECSNAIGSVSKISQCTNAAFLTIYGDTNTQNTCSGTGRQDWTLDEPGTSRALRPVLIHEFGHILGLGHPDETSVPDVTNRQSVMWSSTTTTNRWHNHLWPWEKDCLDEKWGGRKAKGRSISYDFMGAEKQAQAIGTETTQKGNLAGGFSWRYLGATYYAYSFMSPNGDYRRATVGTDGYLSWLNTGTDWSPNPVDTNPLFTNVFPGNAYQHVYYTWVPTRTQDPPEAKGIQSVDFFTNRSLGQMYEWTGSQYAALYTHVPVSSTYDAVSGETVFVAVNTSRTSAAEGGIKVFPGLRSGFRYLERGEYAHSNVSVPVSGYTGWDYTIRTYWGVGVACADSVGSGMGGFNCVLAWVDRGTPDNRLLYTWFRISGTDVVWHGTTYVRGGAYVASHVSAAYTHNQIRVAYRRTGSDMTVGITSNALADLATWSTVTWESGPGYVVDAPTWAGHGNSTESALLWSETF